MWLSKWWAKTGIALRDLVLITCPCDFKSVISKNNERSVYSASCRDSCRLEYYFVLIFKKCCILDRYHLYIIIIVLFNLWLFQHVVCTLNHIWKWLSLGNNSESQTKGFMVPIRSRYFLYVPGLRFHQHHLRLYRRLWSSNWKLAYVNTF